MKRIIYQKKRMKWNEMKWNEMKWNEMKWNGMKTKLNQKKKKCAVNNLQEQSYMSTNCDDN